MEHADWVAFLGRLHPAILHLPIGLIAGVALLEFLSLVNRKAAVRTAPASLVVVAAISAIAAAVSGVVLAREPGYGDDALELHRWLGIGLAALCTVAAVFRVAGGGAKAGPQRGYRLALLGALGVMGATGHLGGTMTHGDDFLTEPLFREASPLREPRPDPVDSTGAAGISTTQASAAGYDAVADFFERRCISCHGESKQRGGLALHTPEAIAHGGDDGPVIVSGDIAASELIRRLRLPLDERGHMPPKAREQPTEGELRLIEEWVRAGAVGLPASASRESPAPASEEPLEHDAAGEQPAPAAETLPAADSEALGRIQAVLAYVAPVGQGSSLLAVDFSAAKPTLTGGEIADLLRPIAANLADLKIARRTLDDSIAPILTAMPRLKRLDVRGSTLSETAAKAIGGLPALEELVLVGATIPTAVSAEILSAPQLRRAYVWKSGVTADDVAKLREARPGLTIDVGEIPTAEALETEPEIKFTSDAPVPGVPQAAATLTPVNSTCPVSGKPIDPRYLVVHEGKVIGFCCPNCPGEFWKDPAKYAAKP
ncbi:MAG: hypothetical protein AMXMBFR47_08990 [Planctomycetota bacterium]